jgi:hypothetical protein
MAKGGGGRLPGLCARLRFSGFLAGLVEGQRVELVTGEGRLVPRAVTAAAQSTTAMGCPSGMPGVDGDEPAGEVRTVKPGLGDERLGGGFSAVEALSVSAQSCGQFGRRGHEVS